MPSRKSFPDLLERASCIRRLNFGADPPGEQPESLEENLRNILQEERRRAIQMWNFDFENELPLEGRWQWERILVPLNGAQEEAAPPPAGEEQHQLDDTGNRQEPMPELEH